MLQLLFHPSLLILLQEDLQDQLHHVHVRDRYEQEREQELHESENEHVAWLVERRTKERDLKKVSTRFKTKKTAADSEKVA